VRKKEIKIIKRKYEMKIVICITRLENVILQERARFVGAEASAEASQVQALARHFLAV
jgi:hypothetical protein